MADFAYTNGEDIFVKLDCRYYQRVIRKGWRHYILSVNLTHNVRTVDLIKMLLGKSFTYLAPLLDEYQDESDYSLIN